MPIRLMAAIEIPEIVSSYEGYTEAIVEKDFSVQSWMTVSQACIPRGGGWGGARKNLNVS